MKRFRHVDVTMTLTSRGVVIRGLPDVGLSCLVPDRRKCVSRRYTSKVSKGAKIRNRYNQVPHLTQDTNGKVTNSQ